MTDEDIKLAAALIDQIKSLEEILAAEDRNIIIAQQFNGKSKQGQSYGQQCFPIATLSKVDARALALPILEALRAELNALRDSDTHRMAETENAGSVRSMGSAGPNGIAQGPSQ